MIWTIFFIFSLIQSIILYQLIPKANAFKIDKIATQSNYE